MNSDLRSKMSSTHTRITALKESLHQTLKELDVPLFCKLLEKRWANQLEKMKVAGFSRRRKSRIQSIHVNLLLFNAFFLRGGGLGTRNIFLKVQSLALRGILRKKELSAFTSRLYG